MALTGQSLGSQFANFPQDYAANVATAKPASGLCASIKGSHQNNLRVADLLGRLRALADAIGGPVPGAAGREDKNPTPLGYIGQINEVNGVMSSMLGLIEEEIGRLEGLAG